MKHDPVTENHAHGPHRISRPAEHSSLNGSTSLLAMIHRLSQPLTALRGSLELALLGQRSATEYRLALKESLAQADHLVWLLDALRELAEPEDWRDLTETIQLEGLVKEVVEELLPVADSRGMSLAFESKEELTVRGSSDKIRQAIFRVIHHAMERSPERGTVRVVLSTLNLSACLRVADEGLAAGPAALDHLGQPSSLDQLFSEALERRTLEWAIAKRIFESQGGTVRVESKPVNGCCFRACLPLIPPRAS